MGFLLPGRFLCGGLLCGGLLSAAALELALCQSQAHLNIQFFEQRKCPLKVLDGLAHLRFEIFGEIDHGGFTVASLAEVLRSMPEIVV